MTLPKEVDHSLVPKPPQKCVAYTVRRNTPCMNNGKWVFNGQCYCYKHAPKKSGTCVICLNPMISAHYLSCGHYFHKKCINRWIKKNNTCPTCREVVIDVDLLKSYQDIFNTISDEYLSISIDIAIQCKTREEFRSKLTELKIT